MNEEVKEVGEELTAEETQSAKDLGLIKDEAEDATDSQEKDEPKEGKEEKTNDAPVDPASFDEMDEAYSKDEKTFHNKFTPNAKALYFKFKRNRQLRQEAQEAAEQATRDRDYLTIKEKAYQKKLTAVNEILDRIDAGDETVTTADVRKVLAFKEEQKEQEEKPVEKPVEKPKQPDQKMLDEKCKNTELLGRSKYPDFDRYVALANDVVAKDNDFAAMITKAYVDPEVDEEELLEKIVKLARTHRDFYKEPEKKKDTPADRIVANSQKKKTSASITGGSGRAPSGYEDLTPEDIIGMSVEEYNKIPNDVRLKLLKQVS
jgi:hypothetical protein